MYKYAMSKVRCQQAETEPLDKEQIARKLRQEMSKYLASMEEAPSIEELVKIAHEMGVVLSRKMAN